MQRIGLPIDDISTGGWTPSPLYAPINEWCDDPNDDTYVQSKDDPHCENHNYDTFEVKLPPWRARRTASAKPWCVSRTRESRPSPGSPY